MARATTDTGYRDMAMFDSHLPRLHLALPVDDLSTASRFYGQALGCIQVRRSETWVEWNLWGHQLVTHLASEGPATRVFQLIDGHHVPVPHFGLLLTGRDFEALATRLRAAGATFVIAPYLRFAGMLGEQWTMLLADPAGNAMESNATVDDT